MIHTIAPCLWFDSKAEEAARFYTSVFPKSRIVRTSYYTAEGQEVHGQKPGTVLTVDFELEGQPFTALNGGPQFKFNEAISLQVRCETQDEIDRYWSALSADPKVEMCGWLKDKFGLSWQIVPAILADLVADKAKAPRVLKAVMSMKKLDIKTLKQAAQ